MSKRGRDAGVLWQPSSVPHPVITMHIPVYAKRGNLFILNRFYILKVESWLDRHKLWHFRHTPCVIFEGVDYNRFCLYGDETLRQAPIHQNIMWCMSKIVIPAGSLNIEPNSCIVQNKTAVISSQGKDFLICPVFDHEVMFNMSLNASHVEKCASSIQRYQAMHFERAWKHIQFIDVKSVEGGEDAGCEKRGDLELTKRHRSMNRVY